MKVILLAGGFGTRLSEHTKTIPKPMINIAGKPMLLHIMKLYAKYGYKDFYIALGYKGEIIKKFFNKKFFDWNINLIETGKNTMTGSRIKRLKKRKRWEPIIVSDNLSWSEFSKLNLFLHEMQGVKPVVALARKYSKDGSSSHIVGYVSDISVKDLENSKLLREINVPGLKTGKNGLEKYLNEEIIGNQDFKDLKSMLTVKELKNLN